MGGLVSLLADAYAAEDTYERTNEDTDDENEVNEVDKKVVNENNAIEDNNNSKNNTKDSIKDNEDGHGAHGAHGDFLAQLQHQLNQQADDLANLLIAIICPDHSGSQSARPSSPSPPYSSKIRKSARSRYHHRRRERKAEYGANIARKTKARRRAKRGAGCTWGSRSRDRVPEEVLERGRVKSRESDWVRAGDSTGADMPGAEETKPMKRKGDQKDASGDETERTERTERGRGRTRTPFVRDAPPHITMIRRYGHPMVSDVIYPRPQHDRDILRFSPSAGDDLGIHNDDLDFDNGNQPLRVNDGNGYQIGDTLSDRGIGGRSIYGDFYDNSRDDDLDGSRSRTNVITNWYRNVAGGRGARHDSRRGDALRSSHTPDTSADEMFMMDDELIPKRLVHKVKDDGSWPLNRPTASLDGDRTPPSVSRETNDVWPPRLTSDKDAIKSATRSTRVSPKERKAIPSGRDFGPAQRVLGGKARHLKPKIDEKRVKALGKWYEKWMGGVEARKKLKNGGDTNKTCANGDLDKPIRTMPTEVMQAVVRFSDYTTILALRASTTALRDLIDKELHGTELLVTRSYSDNAYIARLLVPGRPSWGGATPFLSPYSSPAQQRSALSHVNRAEIKRLPPSGELNTLLGYLPPRR